MKFIKCSVVNLQAGDYCRVQDKRTPYLWIYGYIRKSNIFMSRSGTQLKDGKFYKIKCSNRYWKYDFTQLKHKTIEKLYE